MGKSDLANFAVYSRYRRKAVSTLSDRLAAHPIAHAFAEPGIARLGRRAGATRRQRSDHPVELQVRTTILAEVARLHRRNTLGHTWLQFITRNATQIGLVPT